MSISDAQRKLTCCRFDLIDTGRTQYRCKTSKVPTERCRLLARGVSKCDCGNIASPPLVPGYLWRLVVGEDEVGFSSFRKRRQGPLARGQSHRLATVYVSSGTVSSSLLSLSLSLSLSFALSLSYSLCTWISTLGSRLLWYRLVCSPARRIHDERGIG